MTPVGESLTTVKAIGNTDAAMGNTNTLDRQHQY